MAKNTYNWEKNCKKNTYNWEKNGPTADEVNENENFFPPISSDFTLFRFFNDDVGNVGQHLQVTNGVRMKHLQKGIVESK